MFHILLARTLRLGQEVQKRCGNRYIIFQVDIWRGLYLPRRVPDWEILTASSRALRFGFFTHFSSRVFGKRRERGEGVFYLEGDGYFRVWETIKIQEQRAVCVIRKERCGTMQVSARWLQDAYPYISNNIPVVHFIIHQTGVVSFHYPFACFRNLAILIPNVSNIEGGVSVGTDRQFHYGKGCLFVCSQPPTES